MKNILFVDDERPFLPSLSEGFRSDTEDLNLLIAENGEMAVEVLNTTKIDLVVTDIKMPRMDGFELMAHMSRNFPDIPIIVMTAFGTPELEENLNVLGISQYLEKPLDFDLLKEKILEELNATTKGYVHGLSLVAFLQLVEMEKKTCTLKIKSKEGDGCLYFNKGTLMDAETKNSKGEQAAYEIIGWNQVEIDIQGICKKKKKSIDLSLMQLLMEGVRIKDEKEHLNEERRVEDGTLDRSLEAELEIGETEKVNLKNKKVNLKEVNIMSAQDKLRELSSIEGFVGAGLFTPSGETLATVSGGNNVNVKDIGALANNVLINAQKTSLEMGTGRGQLVHVEAEKAHIIVRCLNEGTDALKSQPGKAHIHLVLILNSDASIGFAKAKIGSVIQSVAEEFRM